MMFSMGLQPLTAKPAAAAATCTDHVLETERRLHIPSGLLLSMALVESGTEGEPRAFALNVNRRTVYARNIRDAARHLRDGKGRLRKDVYVGCMQLSLDHHRGAFNPVETIADPAANVLYAGKMLVRLRRATGSWAEAVARYNGGSERQQSAYLCKVWHHLSQLDGASANLIDPARCSRIEQAEIAPGTRRAFRQSQVAQTN